jgi:PPK2 family polyphosphate:nucleotide phosphotransferase
MKMATKNLRVREGEAVNLKKRPTLSKTMTCSKKEYEKILTKHVSELSTLQALHYASDRNALLLIFQGMDGAGKDGTIKHVMSGVNPQGCQVFSFKHPTANELKHDFLWRTTRELPERGRIGIFNRSYYEEVLITQVHPEILKGESLESDVHHTVEKSKFWKERYQSINDLEKHLHRNGTQIIKFFLHLSEEEQRKRFLARIDDPEKNWKFSNADITERGFWDDYREAYEGCLSSTSTHHSPWYVVPADDKLSARLLVSRIIIETMKGFKMKFPETGPERHQELQLIRKKLTPNHKP